MVLTHTRIALRWLEARDKLRGASIVRDVGQRRTQHTYSREHVETVHRHAFCAVRLASMKSLRMSTSLRISTNALRVLYDCFTSITSSTNALRMHYECFTIVLVHYDCFSNALRVLFEYEVHY